MKAWYTLFCFLRPIRLRDVCVCCISIGVFFAFFCIWMFIYHLCYRPNLKLGISDFNLATLHRIRLISIWPREHFILFSWSADHGDFSICENFWDLKVYKWRTSKTRKMIVKNTLPLDLQHFCCENCNILRVSFWIKKAPDEDTPPDVPSWTMQCVEYFL